MKLNEVIISEGLSDMASKAAYLTGLSGPKGAGKEIAIRDNFTKNFTKKYQVAKQTQGAAFDPVNFVNQYLTHNEWSVNSDEVKTNIAPIANNPAKIAQYVYSVASASATTGAASTPNAQPAPAAKTNTLSPVAAQIGKSITKMVGEENYDDLEYVAKMAMRSLYKQNPEAYNQLYKEIMSGETKKKQGAGAFGQMAAGLGAPSTANTMANAPVSQRNFEPNSNIVRGTNESKRK